MRSDVVEQLRVEVVVEEKAVKEQNDAVSPFCRRSDYQKRFRRWRRRRRFLNADAFEDETALVEDRRSSWFFKIS